MTTYLLVPGSHHGGWWYDPLVAALQDAGHHATAVTLPGLDPTAPASTQVVTLDDHVTAALADFDAARARPAGGAGGAGDQGAVLVGHSYGGSIISAVADARPTQVRALVYLDALLPEDGDSSWSMTTAEEHDWYVDGSRATGGWVDPLPFFDERARPHPLATLMQASRLTGAWRQVPTKHFVVATRWPGPSPMAPMADRARRDPEVVVHEWDTTHNVLADGPQRVFDLLVGL